MRFVLIAATLLAPILPAYAQGSLGVYKVEFRIRDGSDTAAAKTGRRYTILIDSSGHGSFRVGDRVPVATGSFQPGTGGVGVNPLVNTQFSYLDIGVNIEAKIAEHDSKVELASTLDFSTISEHKSQPGSPVIPAPSVAQMKVVINALVPAGKPTLVASIDDPVTQRKVEIEALITKLTKFFLPDRILFPS
jgi:general secretion pathway protein D